MKPGWKTLVVLVALVGVAAWLTAGFTRWQRLEFWTQFLGPAAHADESRPGKEWTSPPGAYPNNQALNVLMLKPEQIQAIGLKTVPVKAQTEPMVLRLTGVTDYIPDTLTVIRSQFDCRVDRVIAQLGSVVRKGDPLLEVFSADLAEAKSNYETASSQWTRDKNVLESRAPLAESEAIPRKELIEIRNDEAKSRLQMKLAKDKLLVYGLTEKEIIDAQNEDGVQKARMTLRSPSDGILIKKSVVKGNYYESKAELMQIAPLDKLWVLGSVSEMDADKVQVGQKVRVIFPYSDRVIENTVEYIDKAIDPETRAARFRATIDNPERLFKSGMFVRVLLEIPPKEGRAVLPRGSMVSVDRLDFVFIKKVSPPEFTAFERRNILVSKETSDWVVAAEPSKDYAGLKPGEQVVTNGSLILEQMYEDRLTVEGEVYTDRPLDDEAFRKPERSPSITVH